jgi:hypothetical protein
MRDGRAVRARPGDQRETGPTVLPGLLSKFSEEDMDGARGRSDYGIGALWVPRSATAERLPRDAPAFVLTGRTTDATCFIG